MKYIVGNWKSHLTEQEAIDLAKEMLSFFGDKKESNKLVLAPISLHLSKIADLLEGSGIAVCGQNCSAFTQGPYTGEITAYQLEDSGAEWVILGHSERRICFGEDVEMICQKVRQALKTSLKIIVCVGESEIIHEANIAVEWLGSDLKEIFKGLSFEEIRDRVWIAYEPIWAIGSGKAATVEEVEKTVKNLKDLLGQFFGIRENFSLPFFYGGSVSPENIEPFLKSSLLDGVLVGNASLKFDLFARMVQTAYLS